MRQHGRRHMGQRPHPQRLHGDPCVCRARCLLHRSHQRDERRRHDYLPLCKLRDGRPNRAEHDVHERIVQVRVVQRAFQKRDEVQQCTGLSQDAAVGGRRRRLCDVDTGLEEGGHGLDEYGHLVYIVLHLPQQGSRRRRSQRGGTHVAPHQQFHGTRLDIIACAHIRMTARIKGEQRALGSTRRQIHVHTLYKSTLCGCERLSSVDVSGLGEGLVLQACSDEGGTGHAGLLQHSMR